MLHIIVKEFFPYWPLVSIFIAFGAIFLSQNNPCGGRKDNSWMDVLWGAVMVLASIVSVMERFFAPQVVADAAVVKDDTSATKAADVSAAATTPTVDDSSTASASEDTSAGGDATKPVDGGATTEPVLLLSNEGE